MKLKYNLPKGLTYRPYLLEMIEENHTLIAGTTGAGKSVLENAIIYALLCTRFPGQAENGRGCRLVLLDPKRVELRQYKKLPHTLWYADNIDDIEQVLSNVRLLIDNRLQIMQKQGVRKSKECPVYIFIDELVDIVTSRKSKEIIKLINDCISISRATNIFFCILTQAPNRKVLKPEIILNMNCRVALRCINYIESRQIIGDDSATELPRHGVGIVQENLDRYKINIPFYSDEELSAIVGHWTKQHPIYNALQHSKN